MKRMYGRVAVVTGAGGPMGRAIVRRLAAEGAALAILDISARRLGETEAMLAGDGAGQVLAERADVLAAAEAGPFAERVLERFGRVDALVNVVGGIRGELYTAFGDIDEARWDATMALNLKGTLHLVQRFAPVMTAAGYGRIVNVSSIAFAGEAGQADYAAAKAAVASLTRSLAAELAPHVNVNCIAPGLIQTSVLERMSPDVVESYRRRNLLGRLGQPEEIAAAALFLASEEASFVTGEILAVSGGEHPAL